MFNKTLITAFILIVIGLGISVLPKDDLSIGKGTPESVEDKLISKIEKRIEKHDNGKYKQIKKTKDGEYEWEVDEYKTPEGDTGYHIILYKEIDGKTYFKSIGTGKESETRTSTWQEL